MRMEVIAMYPDDFEAWKANQLEEYVAARGGHAGRRGRGRVHLAVLALPPGRTGSRTPTALPIVSRPDLYVYAGAAPNLTNLMTRNTFAGATFDLLIPQCRAEVWEAPPDEVGAAYLEGVTPECLNSVEAARVAAQRPGHQADVRRSRRSSKPTDGLYRGMPYLALSEDQIDVLVAYLLERK